MADPVILEKDGFNFANRAVECDSSQQFPTAIFYYTVSNLFFPWKVIKGKGGNKMGKKIYSNKIKPKV